MRRPLAFALLAGLALAGPAGVSAMKEKPAIRSTDLPRPVHPDVPVQTELDAARRAGTLVAYDLFLRRHGDHRLAAAARRERAALAAALDARGR